MNIHLKKLCRNRLRHLAQHGWHLQTMLVYHFCLFVNSFVHILIPKVVDRLGTCKCAARCARRVYMHLSSIGRPRWGLTMERHSCTTLVLSQ